VDIGVVVGLKVGTLLGVDTGVIASFELEVGTLVGIDKLWLLTWILVSLLTWMTVLLLALMSG